MTIQLSRRTVALAVAAFLAVAGLATTSFVLHLTGPAEASHRFNDVGNTNFFHDSTAWLKDNGIATGFGDGTFRPNSNITRGQASFWFGNYNNSLELVTRSATNGGNQFSHYAPCPAGKRAIAGGGRPESSDPDLVITKTQPLLTLAGVWRWSVVWVTRDGTSKSSETFTVWALCAPDTIPAAP